MKCTTDHCNHNALTGQPKCKRHTDEEQRVRSYRLNNAKLQNRVDELTSVDFMSSLKAEVALAQTMLEQRLNSAGSSSAEIVACHMAVNSSLETINRLVASMHKYDLSTGEVLAKPALTRLMGQVVDDIATELEAFQDHPAYADVMDRIADRLAARIKETTNE